MCANLPNSSAQNHLIPINGQSPYQISSKKKRYKKLKINADMLCLSSLNSIPSELSNMISTKAAITLVPALINNKIKDHYLNKSQS